MGKNIFISAHCDSLIPILWSMLWSRIQCLSTLSTSPLALCKEMFTIRSALHFASHHHFAINHRLHVAHSIGRRVGRSIMQVVLWTVGNDHVPPQLLLYCWRLWVCIPLLPGSFSDVLFFVAFFFIRNVCMEDQGIEGRIILEWCLDFPCRWRFRLRRLGGTCCIHFQDYLKVEAEHPRFCCVIPENHSLNFRKHLKTKVVGIWIGFIWLRRGSSDCFFANKIMNCGLQ
jgi:hypothetical protein